MFLVNTEQSLLTPFGAHLANHILIYVLNINCVSYIKKIITIGCYLAGFLHYGKVVPNKKIKGGRSEDFTVLLWCYSSM